jgi:hypothetical protein
VYGYFEQNLNGIPVATLLLSRVACSFDEMLQRQQHMCPTMPRLNIVLQCVLEVVRQLIRAARIGLYLRDWHLGNIGFSDEVDAKMILLDWHGNKPASAVLSEMDRMDWAFLCFANAFVWPPIKSHNDFSGKPLEERNNIKKWIASLTVVHDGLLTWWNEMKTSVRDLPSDSNVSNLYEALQVATESSLQVVNSDVPGGVRASLVEAVGFITTDVSGARCSVRIGADAARGFLAEIVGLQRLHSAAVYKYPRTTTMNSIPLTLRRAMVFQDGFYYHKPTQSTREGYLNPIIVCQKFPFPKVALDPQHFHHVYWKRVQPWHNWLAMSIKARETRFFEYLFDLFTVDPYRMSMQAWEGWQPANRNNASWRGFWLSDGELQALVRETFTVYVASKPLF